MPGTIQIGIMVLPKTETSSNNTFTFKVSMGKREYKSVGEEACSIPVASLRENLIVEIYDTEGTEILQTEFKTISVVEEGVLEGSYPLRLGGHIKMKLQFSLSQDELLRIREMRERALKRKRDERPKTGTISSDLVQSITGKRTGNQVELFDFKEASSGQSRHSDPDSSKPSACMPSTMQQISKTLQVYQRPSDLSFKGDNVQLTKSSQENTRHQLPLTVMNKSHILDFSSSSPSKNSTQHSFSNASELNKIESSVKKMVSAFESSRYLGPNPRSGSRIENSQSKTVEGIDGHLKRAVIPYEESNTAKSEVPRRISKSFSSGMISDITAQSKQAVFENLGAVKSLQMVKDYSKSVDEPNFKNQEPKEFKEIICTSSPIIEPAIESDGRVVLLSQNLKEQDGKINLDVHSKNNTDDNKSSNRNISSHDSEIEYVQVSKSLKSEEECTSLTEAQISTGIIDKYEIIEQTDTISAKETHDHEFCASQADEEITCTNTNETTGFVRDCIFDEYSYQNQGVWTTQGICITTASKQVRDLIDYCKKCEVNNPSEVSSACYQEKTPHEDESLEDKKDVRIPDTYENQSHAKSTSTLNTNRGFLEQKMAGVEISNKNATHNKPDPFKRDGDCFTTWQSKMLFYITTLGLQKCLEEDESKPAIGQTKETHVRE